MTLSCASGSGSYELLDMKKLSFPKQSDINYDFRLEFHDTLPDGISLMSKLTGPIMDSISWHNWSGDAYPIFMRSERFGEMTKIEIFMCLERPPAASVWHVSRVLGFTPQLVRI